MASDTLSIPYRPKAWAMIAVALLCGGAAWIWWAAIQASDGTTPVDIFGVSVPGSVNLVLHWGVVLFLLCLTAVGVVGTVRALQAPSHIVIDADTITAPRRPISRQTVTVSLKDISRMRITSYRGTTTLTLDHPNGRLVIDQRSLAKGVKAEDIVQAIEKRRT